MAFIDLVNSSVIFTTPGEVKPPAAIAFDESVPPPITLSLAVARFGEFVQEVPSQDSVLFE